MVDAARPEPGLPERPRSDPATPSGTANPPPSPPHLADPRALTILTTEHWSLLTSRSLVYNEAFARGSMFLTFMSASLVALGFVVGAAGPERALVVIAILALDLFVGLATLGRLVGAGTEEVRALLGMARLRHAYLELVPTLEPYFVSPRHDDIGTVLAEYSQPDATRLPAQDLLHGLTTMPGLVGAIDAAVGGALIAVVAAALGAPSVVAALLGVIGGVAMVIALASTAGRIFLRQGRSLVSRFPAPDPPDQPSRRNT